MMASFLPPELLDHVGVAGRELGLDVLGVRVLHPEVVRVGAVHRQPGLPADHRDLLVVQVLTAGVTRGALGHDHEDLVRLHQLLGGGDVAGGVTAVVDVDQGDLAGPELAGLVRLGHPGLDPRQDGGVRRRGRTRGRDDHADLDVGVGDPRVVLAGVRRLDRLQIGELVARIAGAPAVPVASIPTLPIARTHSPATTRLNRRAFMYSPHVLSATALLAVKRAHLGTPDRSARNRTEVADARVAARSVVRGATSAARRWIDSRAVAT